MWLPSSTSTGPAAADQCDERDTSTARDPSIRDRIVETLAAGRPSARRSGRARSRLSRRRSRGSNGPRGWPAPRRSARSIVSGGATPSATASRASSAMASTIRSRIAVGARRSSGSTSAVAPPRRSGSRRRIGRTRRPSCGRGRRPATSRSWIGDGRSRSGRPRPSQIPVAAARLTSIPVRSISSNGPIGKPSARSASSISVTRAAPASRMRSASMVNGRLTRLTMKPGPVGADDRGLAPGAHDRHGAGDDRRVGQRRCDDLDERHERRGVEEVQADDAARAGRRLGDLGDREGARVGGQDHLGRRRRRRASGRSSASAPGPRAPHSMTRSASSASPSSGRHVPQPVEPGRRPSRRSRPDRGRASPRVGSGRRGSARARARGPPSSTS